MKKILIPVTAVALILLVGAGCYSKKSTVNTTRTNPSNLNASVDTGINGANGNDSIGNVNANSDLTVNGNTNSATNSAGNLNSNVNATTSTAPSTVSVSISGFAFNPSSVTVKKGGTVVFTNNDSVGHTVKIGGTDHSVSPGGSYTLSTSGLAVGANDYSCSIHPSMTGTINVVQG